MPSTSLNPNVGNGLTTSRRVPSWVIVLALALAYAAFQVYPRKAPPSPIPVIAPDAPASQWSGDTQPVLLEFWAAWCSNCRSMEPLMARLAQRLQGRIRVLRVDYDASPALRARFKVEALPTLALLSKGVVLGRRTGLAAEPELQAFVDAALQRAGESTSARSNCALGAGALGVFPICD